MTAVALFVLAGVIVGYSKTAFGGLAVISVVIFASLLPVRESTGALLLVLIVGDLMAVWHYRHDGDWRLIRELLPLVVPGLALGAAFLAVVDDAVLRRTIGVLLLVLVLLQLVLQHRTRAAAAARSRTRRTSRADAPAVEDPALETGPAPQTAPGVETGPAPQTTPALEAPLGVETPPTARTDPRVGRPGRAGDLAPSANRRPSGAALLAGLAAGFTTMTANAAGAVMTLFLVARGVEKRRFIGTGAWFFLGVNITKLPFSVGLGLIDVADVRRALLLAPAVLVGGWLGLHTIRRISQARFEQVVLVASALAAAALIVR